MSHKQAAKVVKMHSSAKLQLPPFSVLFFCAGYQKKEV